LVATPSSVASDVTGFPPMDSAHFVVPIDGQDLTPPLVDKIFGSPVRAHVAASVMAVVVENREHLEQLIKQDRLFYGINTGFGSLCDRKISPDQLESLQENLLMSHAVGVGEPVPDEIVRLMMHFKILSLSRGHSGIRSQTLELLAQLLSADLLPVVPSKGSLGASGDLAPLAHLSLPLIGRGMVRINGRIVKAAEALAAAEIQPVKLAAKEGLALINGTQFMSAYAAALCVRARRLCKIADILAAMSLEAVRGRLEPFDVRIHALRPHAGAMTVAHNVRQLLADRPSNTSKPYGIRVQDPYSLRCVPTVHGATRDALEHVEQVTYREINSVTDNPLVFEEAILSGGNFHGQPLALTLDYLAIAVTELASISERRQYLLVNDMHYGLPPALTSNSGLNSGFMIAHYTSAALISENKVLCHPASVDSIPTSGGQEDHVSMGATSALKCWQIGDNVEHVLGIELLVAAQALDFTPAAEIAPTIRRALETVREKIPAADGDREFGIDIETALGLVKSQSVTRAVESITGLL
jgi:histidine ammonia-lyase